MEPAMVYEEYSGYRKHYSGVDFRDFVCGKIEDFMDGEESEYLNEKGEKMITSIYDRIRAIPNDSYHIPSIREFKIISGIVTDGWYQYPLPVAQVGYIYFIKEVESGRVKIGFSNSPEKRLKSLQTANPNRLMIVNIVRVSDTRKCETDIKSQLKVYQIKGEWYDIPDKTEINLGGVNYILWHEWGLKSA